MKTRIPQKAIDVIPFFAMERDDYLSREVWIRYVSLAGLP